MKLKREINLPEAILYGVGILVGAGIYSLIGLGAGVAGNLLWLSFLIAAFVAVCTVFSYVELSTIIGKDAAEYHYTKKAFSNELFSFIIGWLLFLGTAFAAAVVAMAFSGYFSSLFGTPAEIIALALIILMSAINYLGIKYSAIFNSVSSLLAVAGLLILSVLGLVFLPHDISKNPDFFQLPQSGFFGVIGAVSLIFFAYVGFENLVNVIQEIKSPKSNLPKALLISLLISTLLYVLVSFSALNVASPLELAATSAPLAIVGSRVLGSFSFLVSISALFATASSCLIFLLAGSRMLYGMAESGSLPKLLNEKPQVSMILICLASLFVIVSFNLKSAAEVANLSIFIAYLCVNLSLIALSFSSLKRSFISPRLLGVPVFAYLGVLFCIFFLAFFSFDTWLFEIISAFAGLLIYLAFKICPCAFRT